MTGEQIRAIRLARGMSQKQLAEEIGTSQTRVSQAERNIRPLSNGALQAVGLVESELRPCGHGHAPNAKTEAALREAETMRVKPASLALKVNVNAALAAQLETLLSGRGITLDEVVGLYLRSMVNSFDRGRALTLASKMPFGKYRGEDVGMIVRADPGYMRFLISAERPLMVEPEVLALL